MARTSLLDLVDQRRFSDLFVEHLGWTTPDQGTKTVTVETRPYSLHQVARFDGLRVWWCDELPDTKVQRAIDAAIAHDDLERLVIFTGTERQDWRWPRRAQGGAPARLLNHQHTVGQPDEHLASQLEAIRLKISDNLNLVEILRRMRGAFDKVAESNSSKAARLMNALYVQLHDCHVGEHEATLLLARLLFLMFGDDSMWRKDQFKNWVQASTTAATLNEDVNVLFDVLDQDVPHRMLPAGSAYADFRYVNGGLFRGRLRLPALSEQFRSALVEACEFDWSGVSPAVFGSMFQTVKDKDARRLGGEHYTTEKNILKTLGPLFLDELHERFEKVRNDKAGLTKLLNHLGRLRVLDPACGCGNFLIVAYRELRALELDVMRQRKALDGAGGPWEGQRSMLSTDFEVKVRLDHFAGIEIDEWPAQIARTALLLVDHQANEQTAEYFAEVPDRLPIKIAPLISEQPMNALTTDWSTIFEPSEDVIVVGNPPFIGQYTKTTRQTADAKAVWGARYNGYLDYVTAWYAKTIDYFGTVDGRWAFVSTNSVSQGEATEYLWRPILDAGWRCRFAHRSFEWTTESLKKDGAVVHVSIIGFDRKTAETAQLVEYEYGGKGEGRAKEVANINPYLLDAPNIFVHSATRPLSPALPRVIYGSKPTDDGNLLISPDEIDDVLADPIARRYVRKFVGARELLHDKQRWCLWMPKAPRDEIEASPVLRERTLAVARFRSESSDKATRQAAVRAHEFQYDRQPSEPYLAIPAHVSETRAYFVPSYLDADTICGNANFLVPDADGFAFGILASAMFTAWMRAIGGRIKSDLRFANTFTYNTFPLPAVSTADRAAVCAAARAVIDARNALAGTPLADMYSPGRMDPALRAAHSQLDAVIDALFAAPTGIDELGRQRLLLARYADLTQQAVLV